MSRHSLNCDCGHGLWALAVPGAVFGNKGSSLLTSAVAGGEPGLERLPHPGRLALEGTFKPNLSPDGLPLSRPACLGGL